MADSPVPARRTTFTVRDYSRAVLRSWRVLCGGFPSKASVGCLWAQYAHETGRGAFCFNFNIGNVKHQPGHDYMMLRGTWEIENGKRVVYEPPHRATWFNSYPSLDEAMADHLRFLKEKRYASSWPAIVNGDPTEFAVRLKVRGYYTAPLADYAKALRAFHAEFMQLSAYEEAMTEILRTLEAETNPELHDVAPGSDPEEDVIHELPVAVYPDGTRIVHPRVPLAHEPPDPDETGTRILDAKDIVKS